MAEYVFTYAFMIAAVSFAGIALGLVFRGLDRKLVAYFQSRVGPPLVQPFYDMVKLMGKQTIVPENAVPWVFNGAPLAAFASSLLLLNYLWLGTVECALTRTSLFNHADDVILFLYILMAPAICLVLGGFASGSVYSAVGAQREMVLLINTDLPLSVAVITVAWKISSLAPSGSPFLIGTISSANIWASLGPAGIMGAMLLFITLAVIVPAELGKVPFDQPEAETEIAEGVLAEYSGRNLAFFQLAEAVKALALTSFIVMIFFPFSFTVVTGFSGAIGGYDFTAHVNLVFFFLKVALLYTFSISVTRSILARLKIRAISRFFVFVLTATGLCGYLLLVLDPIITGLR